MSGPEPPTKPTQAAARCSFGDAKTRCRLPHGVAGEQEFQQCALGGVQANQEFEHCHGCCAVVRGGIARRRWSERAARTEPLEPPNGSGEASCKVRKQKAGKALFTRPIGEEFAENKVAFVADIVQLCQAYPGPASQGRTDPVEIRGEALVESVAELAVAALGQTGQAVQKSLFDRVERECTARAGAALVAALGLVRRITGGAPGPGVSNGLRRVFLTVERLSSVRRQAVTTVLRWWVAFSCCVLGLYRATEPLGSGVAGIRQTVLIGTGSKRLLHPSLPFPQIKSEHMCVFYDRSTQLSRG